MADFKDTLHNHPALIGHNIPVATIDALVDEAIQALYGYHRWPFLKKVNQVITWTANAATKSFNDISRITNIRVPESGISELRVLEFMGDDKFTHTKFAQSGANNIFCWRDAGVDSNRLTIELFSVPTTAAALQCDMYLMPNSGSVNTLPAHFRRLIRQMVLSEIPNSGITLANVDYAVREAVSREEDMLGDVDYIGPDYPINEMMQRVNNPS